MVNPNKASKARGKGGASPNKSNKFTPKKFGSPIRTKKVWGNYIDAYQTAVPWLVIGIPIRSDKHMSPWMKPIMEALEKDNGKLHSEMKLACVADRKGSKDEEGKYKPMKRVKTMMLLTGSVLSRRRIRRLCQLLILGATWLKISLSW